MSSAFLYSKLDHPEILPAFLGIFLGVIVGSIPVAIPGMPTPLNFFMANSANLMLRELGITIFLSCVSLALRFSSAAWASMRVSSSSMCS